MQRRGGITIKSLRQCVCGASYQTDTKWRESLLLIFNRCRCLFIRFSSPIFFSPLNKWSFSRSFFCSFVVVMKFFSFPLANKMKERKVGQGGDRPTSMYVDFTSLGNLYLGLMVVCYYSILDGLLQSMSAQENDSLTIHFRVSYQITLIIRSVQTVRYLLVCLCLSLLSLIKS